MTAVMEWRRGDTGSELELADARGRVLRLRAAADRRRDAAAVGLVADGDDPLAAAGDDGAQVGRCRSGREAFVELHFETGRLRDRLRGLARAEQRARDDRVDAVRGEAFPERARLLASLLRERPQLVRLAGL